MCAQLPVPPTLSPPALPQHPCPSAGSPWPSRAGRARAGMGHQLPCIPFAGQEQFLQHWRSQLAALPRLQWTGGSRVRRLFSRPHFDGVSGASLELSFLSLPFAVHAAGQGIYKRSSATGDVQNHLGATHLLSQSRLGLTLWAAERGSEQSFWQACVRRGVRGGGRNGTSAAEPSVNVRSWFESRSLKWSDVSSVAVGSIGLN